MECENLAVQIAISIRLTELVIKFRSMKALGAANPKLEVLFHLTTFTQLGVEANDTLCSPEEKKTFNEHRNDSFRVS